MASLEMSELDPSVCNTAHARRWAARLCLACDEREARRTLWEAFLDLGFEAVAALRWHSAGRASVLWRTPAVPAVTREDPPTAAWHAEAQLDLGVKIWVIRRTPNQPCGGPAASAETYADFRQVQQAFGHSPWRLLLSVPHHTDSQTLSVGAASTAPFEERRQSVGAVRFLSDLYFALRAGNWQGADRLQAPPTRRPAAPPPLTPPQIACLRWAVAGKTYRDIGAITSLSPRTVRFHLENARKTYGFATITQTLVQSAKDFGLDPYDGRPG